MCALGTAGPFQQSCFNSHPVIADGYAQVSNSPLAIVEQWEVSACPFLQPVQVTLNGRPILMHINCSPQFVAMKRWQSTASQQHQPVSSAPSDAFHLTPWICAHLVCLTVLSLLLWAMFKSQSLSLRSWAISSSAELTCEDRSKGRIELLSLFSHPVSLEPLLPHTARLHSP